MKQFISQKFLPSLGNKELMLIPAVGAAILFLVLGIILLIFHIVLISLFFLLMFCGLILLIVIGIKTNKKQLLDDIEELIFNSTKENGINNFSVEAALEDCEVSYDVIRNAQIKAYEKCVEIALDDFKITGKERDCLEVLSRKLDINQDYAKELEGKVRGEVYDNELMKRLDDHVLTSKETDELRAIKKALGLSETAVRRATHKSAIEGYRSLFVKFAKFGIDDQNVFQELYDLAKSTGITPAEAAVASSKEAISLYRRTVSMVCQDGIITETENEIIKKLETILQLDSKVIVPFKKQLRDVRELQGIREGKLPQVKHEGFLRSTEICHWFFPCRYEYETETKSKSFHGDLTVTNSRMIFNSPEKSIEFGLSKILNVDRYSNAVELTCGSTRGQGVYYTDKAIKLAAIIEALVKRSNYDLVQNLDAERTRHIPSDVKREVWQRDGGKCTRCGATEYLEFDHIIPFSRGGSNGFKNIQLLCRRCNLAKGSELC